jgi:hypothetical protein
MSARTLTILLIEDHADTALVFARVLRRDHHQVTVAHSVREAEQACHGHPFDLLICDVELPDGTGFHLLERARRACSGARGIIISAHSDDRRQAAAREAGFAAYLVKPLRIEDLRRAIERVSRYHAAGFSSALPPEPPSSHRV